MTLSNTFTGLGTSVTSHQDAQQSNQSILQKQELIVKKRSMFSSSAKPLKKRRHNTTYESQKYSLNSNLNSDHVMESSIRVALASRQLQQPNFKSQAPLYFLPVIHTTHMHNKYVVKLELKGNSAAFDTQCNPNINSLVVQHQDKSSSIKLAVEESTYHEDPTSIEETQAQDYDIKREQMKPSKNYSGVTLPLSHPQDKDKLSNLQCFLREQIEFFIATTEDVTTYSRGRNKRVEVGQAGIRCKHCSTLSVKDRSKGSTYFPSTLAGIYQAAQNMYHYHFCTGCPKMAQVCTSHFNEILSSRSCYGGGKDYWSMSAERMGLIETMVGLKIKNCSTNPEANQFCSEVDEASLRELELATKNASNIVKPDDRSLITDYIFLLFSQMLPCHPTQRAAGNSLPGLVCKHCEGCNGNGAFFRKKVSSLSKNENLAQINKHLTECQYCPDGIKSALKNLKERHPFQTRGLKRGHKKEFFTQMVARISAQSPPTPH